MKRTKSPGWMSQGRRLRRHIGKWLRPQRLKWRNRVRRNACLTILQGWGKPAHRRSMTGVCRGWQPTEQPVLITNAVSSHARSGERLPEQCEKVSLGPPTVFRLLFDANCCAKRASLEGVSALRPDDSAPDQGGGDRHPAVARRFVTERMTEHVALNPWSKRFIGSQLRSKPSQVKR